MPELKSVPKSIPQDKLPILEAAVVSAIEIPLLHNEKICPNILAHPLQKRLYLALRMPHSIMIRIAVKTEVVRLDIFIGASVGIYELHLPPIRKCINDTVILFHDQERRTVSRKREMVARSRIAAALKRYARMADAGYIPY